MTLGRRHAVLGFLFLALHTVAAANPRFDPDLFHVLALAREAVALGRIPREDSFAYTPTRVPVVHHEWGTAMLLHAVTSRGGAPGLAALKYALHLGTLAGALRVAWLGGARVPVLVSLAPLGIALLTPGLTTLRAQVLTLAFVASLLWMLARDRAGSRRWVPAYLGMHVVWLNAHGGFVVGPVLLAAHAVEQRLRGRPVRHVVSAVVAAVALTVVNPWGLEYYAYLAEALTMDRSAILEWRPLGTAYPAGLVVWAVAVALAAYGVWRRGPGDAAGWLLVLLTAAAALRAQRHVSIFGLVWLAYVPAILQPTRIGIAFERLWGVRPRVTAAVLAAAVLASLVRVVAGEKHRLRLPGNPTMATTVVYPTGVVEHLRRERFTGNVAVPFDVGAFVSWALHPAVKVSIDGRYEAAYHPALLAEHVALYQGLPGWRTVLEKYPTDAVLLRRHSPGDRTLRADGRWRLAYEDNVWVLFVRPGVSLAFADRQGERLPDWLPAPGLRGPRPADGR